MQLTISDGDVDWWRNDKGYEWGPFYGAGTYEVVIRKGADKTLHVRLKVPGADEVTFEAPVVTPKQGEVRVSLRWDVIDGFKMSQNGQNTLHVPLPSTPRSRQH